MAEINLSDLFSVAITGISNRKRYFQCAIGRNFFGIQFAAAEIKLRITQSVAERIERLAVEVTVSAVAHRVIRKIQQVRRRGIKRHWQMAARINVAEENFANRQSPFLAGIPGLQN